RTKFKSGTDAHQRNGCSPIQFYTKKFIQPFVLFYQIYKLKQAQKSTCHGQVLEKFLVANS
ncbi:hypothetical protein, partial [Aerococcus sp. HMSC062A02]|uniref:hypothetical protein n=1 Tax=Aerococcus sp. HMSC062A02 TaxID=1715105 RepID=UPI001AEFED34